MRGQWIWLREQETENQRGCFGAFFQAEDEEAVTLHISASTRYVAYVNGKEVGKGPVRTEKGEGHYDVYPLEGFLKEGENYLAVHVWSYGWSTYQSIQDHGGVIFEVTRGEEILCASGENTKAALDCGHQSFVPKRNVNLGFSDYYDARKFDSLWMEKPELVKGWNGAKLVGAICEHLKERPIRPFNWENHYPQHIVSVQQVKRGCQQISVNTRKAFFGERADGDETIFSGFLGFVFECPRDMEGTIVFPNRTWNGLLGDFRIDEKRYEVTNKKRDVRVRILPGRHLFLMQFSGKYDDLYCHMELSFPEKLIIVREDRESGFFVVGPTQRIIPVIDGYARVYGGLDEFNRMEQETEEHERLFRAKSVTELKNWSADMGISFSWIEERYVFWDSYLLSLARTEQVTVVEPVQDMHLGMLWANSEDTVLTVPNRGDYRRIIVDFSDLYVGNFEFQVKAAAGTVLDVYCYENAFDGEIDYTIGLNNGFRYICKEGWQRYSCMVRMGVRYAMITVRNASTDVRIRDFHLRHSTYAVSRRSEFTCDDFLLNRIFEMCRHTHELCLEDSFTDCPTYEQAFWIGDAQLTALINAYVYGDYELIRRNLKLAVSARINTKLFNALTPTDWNTSIPMWMMNWIISIQQYVDVTGDESVVTELLESVELALDYYEEFVQKDGSFLINAWNMMDWAEMDIQNYGVVTGQQAILAWCYELGAQFVERDERVKKAEHYRNVRKALLQYLDREMWDEKRQCYLDGFNPDRGLSKTVSIQTHVFMYLYDAILDNRKREITEGYLKSIPKEFVQVGSPFMLYYLHACLQKLGQQEQIFEDIRQRWGEMLRYDSTTCWEVFPGFYENSRTRSYCHSWSASPAIYCLTEVLGIQRAEKGWKKIRIQIPEKTGNWCRGSIPTPFGVVRASWNRKERYYKLWVPEGIEVDAFAMQGWKVIKTVLSV